MIVQFNTTIDRWIAALDAYSHGMLCLQPSPGSWSLGQVYVHLLDNTGYFAGQAERCLQNNTDGDGEMTGDGKWLFCHNGFPDAMFEGPSTGVDIRQPATKAELRDGLLEIRTKMNQLAHTPAFSTATGKTRHPGLGYFNAREWLQFAEMHLRHHFRQKQRIDDVLFSVPHFDTDTEIRKTIYISAPASRVWRELTTPALMAAWMTDAEMKISSEWKTGSAIFFRGDLHGIVYESKGVIQQLETGKVLAYTYWTSLSQQEDKPENYSGITFRLKESGNGTELAFEQLRLPPGTVFKHFNFYWSSALERLRKASERQHSE